MQRIQYDREKIIELIQRRNWNEVILLLRDDGVYRELKLDPITDRIVTDYFIHPLISDPSAEYLPFLEQFYALHHDRAVQFALEDSQIKKVAARLAKAYYDLGVRETAIRYAKEAPEEAFCRRILGEARSEKPEAPTFTKDQAERGNPRPEAREAEKKPPAEQNTEHSRPAAFTKPPADRITRPERPSADKPPANDPVSVKTPAGDPARPATGETGKGAGEAVVPEGDLTSGIFSSEQDYQFYAAVRDAYPSYLVFPRVAFITLVEYGLIRNALSQEERECYYKSSVDCVVFGPEDYKPIAFIENERDDRPLRLNQMKEKIVSLIGFTLYRIANQSDRRETIRLIRQSVKF